MRVAVLGAGISGLAAAWRLRERGASPVVYEARDRVGGVIQTSWEDGFQVEHGPNTLQAGAAPLREAVDALGLAPRVRVAGAEGKKRFVVRDARPIPLPTSLGEFVRSPLLSPAAKLRLLAEPFHGGGEADESVAEFVRRRLGPEVLDYAVNPFVAGVYAGDPERLSLRHAFPKLHALEREHGSLLRGALAGLRHRSEPDADAPPAIAPSPRDLVSFDGGLQALPDAFADALGQEALRLGRTVTALETSETRWLLRARDASGRERTYTYDAIVSTLPLHALARLNAPELDLGMLPQVAYPPLTVLHLGFRREDVAHPLDGFGMLVPEQEVRLHGFGLLGALFPSTLFPARAPEGHVLLTCFLGGARRPDLGRADAATQRATALRDLRQLLGVRGEPVFERRVVWPRAIPQYEVGYAAVIERLGALEARHPSLAFAGNYRSGVAVADALASGLEAAERLGSLKVESPAGIAADRAFKRIEEGPTRRRSAPR